MVLRYLGVLLESYIDISYILTRSEFLGMPHLPVTNLVTNLLQKFVTYVTNLLHTCYSGFHILKLQKQDCVIEIDAMSPQWVV